MTLHYYMSIPHNTTHWTRQEHITQQKRSTSHHMAIDDIRYCIAPHGKRRDKTYWYAWCDGGGGGLMLSRCTVILPCLMSRSCTMCFVHWRAAVSCRVVLRRHMKQDEMVHHRGPNQSAEFGGLVSDKATKPTRKHGGDRTKMGGGRSDRRAF